MNQVCAFGTRLPLNRQNTGPAIRLKRCVDIGIGLLPGDAPIFQLVKRDDIASHGATHMRPRSDNLKIRVEIPYLGFPQGVPTLDY